MDNCNLTALPGLLLPWYEEHKRDLPWRKDQNPYHIWLSEIMLQQTRVEAVKGYYARFLEALPRVEDLANCDDDRLTKLWEGLGYYSRVRNLKKTAQVIAETYGGVFPGEYEDVLALPGIGEYTAGAVCSICFDQKVAAVDGNVLRVVSRLRDDATPIDSPAYKKQVKRDLEAVYPEAAGDFTQALMELGATVCGPNRKPDCENCPCREFCLGYQRGTCESLPVKAPKKEKRREARTVFVLSCDGCFALTKRPAKGLLAGLWQFPDVEGALELEEALAFLRKKGLEPKEIYRKVEKKHIFTHIQWDMTGYYLETADKNENFRWLTKEELEAEAALPTAYRQFWNS